MYMSPAGINTLLVSCPALASSSASSGAATQQRLAMTRPVGRGPAAAVVVAAVAAAVAAVVAVAVAAVRSRPE